MHSPDDIHFLGFVLKTTGTRGEVIISIEDGLPENFELKESLFIEVDGLLVPFFIDYYKEKSSSTMIFKFVDYDEESVFIEFTDCKVYAVFPNLRSNNQKYSSYKGYQLLDSITKNPIGEIKEYLDIKENPLFSAITNQQIEMLFPAHDDLISEVDHKKKTILYNLPDGILDL